jgi:hypothetical protein
VLELARRHPHACAQVLVFQRGIELMLRDILAPQQQATLVESIQQLAAKHPAEVYRYVAEMINAGAKVKARERQQPRMGFSGPSAEDGHDS